MKVGILVEATGGRKHDSMGTRDSQKIGNASTCKSQMRIWRRLQQNH